MDKFRSLAIIPAFKAVDSISVVVNKLSKVVDHVLIVDDACPEGTGKKIAYENHQPEQVSVLFRRENGGVGAAMKTGFDWALQRDFHFIVKVDADDQMDVARVPQMISLIATGQADAVKGNRFDSVGDLEGMPVIRILGNAGLSLIAKFSSGLWTINDPTNGFFAISRLALEAVQHQKLNDGFFFESDMLFRLGLSNCNVQELPMSAIYGRERSNLVISRVLFTFPFLHSKNMLKRLAYKYFIQEWSLGTLNLIGAALMFVFALLLGIDSLAMIRSTGERITAGQAVGVSLSAILGFQLLLGFLSYDVQMERRGGQRFPVFQRRG